MGTTGSMVLVVLVVLVFVVIVAVVVVVVAADVLLDGPAAGGSFGSVSLAAISHAFRACSSSGVIGRCSGRLGGGSRLANSSVSILAPPTAAAMLATT